MGLSQVVSGWCCDVAGSRFRWRSDPHFPRGLVDLVSQGVDSISM